MLFFIAFVCTACTHPKEAIVNDPAVVLNNTIKDNDGNARLEPQSGCYFGVVRDDLTLDTIRGYSVWLGFTPAAFVTFVKFPMRQQDIDKLKVIKEIIPTGGIVLVTLEPLDGLNTISKQDCQDFATLCVNYEKQGLGVMVRFAHEMNGTWYPWCQSPTLYKEKFRLLAQYVHTNTHNTAMLWTPNSGGGYPFLGGPYGVQPGTPEYSVLDTDGNNKLDMNDDMYTPYYPGDDAVDWVGMSVYHWGQSYPWIENELPEARNFTDQITGNYNGLNGNQLAVPDFYSMFCNDGVHNKPMAIPETAAFYNTEQGGASELAIKQAWWHQVFNHSGDTNDALDISVHFPKIKMINWFDIQKNEAEAKGNLVDWRISGNTIIQSAFTRDQFLLENSHKYLLFAK